MHAVSSSTKPCLLSTDKNIAHLNRPVVVCAQHPKHGSVCRRSLLSGLVSAAIISPEKVRAESLVRTGASSRDVYARGEANLEANQQDKGHAAQTRCQWHEERHVWESQGGASPCDMDKPSCGTMALLGALVGGVAAQSVGLGKVDVAVLAQQLRRLTHTLRRQLRATTQHRHAELAYAAPSTGGSWAGSTPTTSACPAVKVQAPSFGQEPQPQQGPHGATSTLLSMEDEDMSEDQVQCRDALYEGKRLLKAREGAAAMAQFDKALGLSRALGDKVQEKRAARGMAASAKLQGKHSCAIKYLECVLEIAQDMHENSSKADAYGSIADCYVAMGDFEKAAQYYDLFITNMARNTASLDDALIDDPSYTGC